MVVEFASRPHTCRLVSIGIGGFLYTRGTGRRSGARKPVNILLLIPSKKMWPSRPHLLVLSQQFSFTLGQPEVCAGTNLCWRYTCSLLHWLQAKCRQHHLSENIGPAIARSARPAPPALYERNECVKETLSHWRLKQLECR